VSYPFAPSVAESREAERLGAEIGWEQLKKTAALRVSCVDCGRLIGVVTYVRGRALVTTRALDDRLAPERRIGRSLACSWLDRGLVLHARCKVRAYVLPAEEMRRRTPPPGRPRAPDFDVSHAYTCGVL
jgi:hypothetical protein